MDTKATKNNKASSLKQVDETQREPHKPTKDTNENSKIIHGSQSSSSNCVWPQKSPARILEVCQSL
jgi:hypothetical protein